MTADQTSPTARCGYCGANVALRSLPTPGGGAIMAAEVHVSGRDPYNLCRGESGTRLAAAQAERDALRAMLVAAEDALRTVGRAALVVKPSLDKPYPDDDHWSPWTRFMELPARTAYNLGCKIRRDLGVFR